MRRRLGPVLLIGLLMGVLAGMLAGIAPAQAVHLKPLSIDVTRLSSTYAVVKVTCPDDPPARIYLAGTVDGQPQLLGTTEPFRCTRRPQTFRLDLVRELASGTEVSDAVVTFSGDSGEINGFLGTLVVR
jgi:hypothetical protein